LKEVGYPIISWREEFNQAGLKDPFLIQYLGAKGYTWITKDDAAKKQHEDEIRTAGISVVWLRGLERAKHSPAAKNDITIKEVHKMLTDKLDYIKEQIETSKSACYFLLYIKSGGIPAVNKIELGQFCKK
jgi:hypothetical protein